MASNVATTEAQLCKPQNPAGSVSQTRGAAFPFALRARIVATGEQTLKAIRKKIGFLLLTEDISPSRVHQILKQFPGLPVYQRYTSEDFKTFSAINRPR